MPTEALSHPPKSLDESPRQTPQESLHESPQDLRDAHLAQGYEAGSGIGSGTGSGTGSVTGSGAESGTESAAFTNENLPRRSAMPSKPLKPLKPLKPIKPRASQTRGPHLSGAKTAAQPGRLQRSLFNYLGFFLHLIACFPFTLVLAFVGGAIIGLAGLKAGTLLSCTILAFLFGSMSMLYGFLSVKLVAFFFRHNAAVVRHVSAGAIGFWLLASTLYIFSIPKAPAESVAVLIGCLCNALSQYLTMLMLTRDKSALHPPAA